MPLGRPECLVVTWGSGIQATPSLQGAQKSQRHRELSEGVLRAGRGSPTLLAEPYLELRLGGAAPSG